MIMMVGPCDWRAVFQGGGEEECIMPASSWGGSSRRRESQLAGCTEGNNKV